MVKHQTQCVQVHSKKSQLKIQVNTAFNNYLFQECFKPIGCDC